MGTYLNIFFYKVNHNNIGSQAGRAITSQGSLCNSSFLRVILSYSSEVHLTPGNHCEKVLRKVLLLRCSLEYWYLCKLEILFSTNLRLIFQLPLNSIQDAKEVRPG